MNATGYVLMFLFGTLLVVSVLAAVARRILGIRVGVLRTLLAGAVGVVAESMFGTTVHLAGHRGVLITLQLGVGLLIAMGFFVVAEAVLPSGSLGGPMEWVRAVKARIARTRRYSQITSIGMHHGLGGYLRGRHSRSDTASEGLARSLRLALEEGGVTFVKLGQVVATRPDVLPPEFIAELSRLHSQVAPVPWEQVGEVLTEELGRPAAEVFAHISPTPIAAGAIAQVHEAILVSGARVAVKVQRPGIRSVVEQDLDIMRRIVRMLHNRTQWGRRMGLLELADGFAAALLAELDFRIEARNTVAVAAAGQGCIALPEIYPDFTTARIMVLGWLDGTPVGSLPPPASADEGAGRAKLATKLLDCLLRQVMVDGIFHADPHPGNVLVLADGRLALLDFGSVAHLDSSLRAALQHLMLAVNSGDPAALCDALLELIDRPDDIDEHRLERALGRFMAVNLRSGAGANMSMFADLLMLTAEFGLAMPPEIAAVFRSLVTLDGTLSRLSEGFNLVDNARSAATARFVKQFGPQSIGKAVTNEALALLPMLRRLPRRVDRITGALERGQFSVQVRVLADERERQVITGLLNTVLTAFLGGVTGIMAVIMLSIRGGPAITDTMSLYQVIGYNLLTVSCILVLRVLFVITRRHA